MLSSKWQTFQNPSHRNQLEGIISGGASGLGMEGVDRPDFSQFMANSTADENVMQFDKNNSINHNSS